MGTEFHTSQGYWAITGEHLAQHLLRLDSSQGFKHQDQEAARLHVRARLRSASAKNIFSSLFALVTQWQQRGRGDCWQENGVQREESEKTVRDSCRSLQERQCMSVWIERCMSKGGLGNVTVKPPTETKATAAASSDSARHKPDSSSKLFGAEI